VRPGDRRLLTDLKRLGLFERRWSSGAASSAARRPSSCPAGANAGKINGRDHNHWGFTVWLAGGGVKGGQVYGATDEFGFKAVENPVHVHDLHATILHLLGFDHERLTYRYAGRDFRLTDVHGRVFPIPPPSECSRVCWLRTTRQIGSGKNLLIVITLIFGTPCDRSHQKSIYSGLKLNAGLLDISFVDRTTPE
jgi:hypothetical protein